MNTKDNIIRGFTVLFVIVLVGIIARAVINEIYDGSGNFIIQNSIVLLIGLFAGVVTALFMRILHLKSNDKKLIYEMAYVDKITGMKNKNKFILEAIDILTKKEDNYAIVVLEVNNFEVINELFGFDEGNSIIRYVAKVIERNLFDGEIFARASAGRFNFLLKYDNNEGIRTRLEMIMDDISEYRRTGKDGAKCSVTSCCGVYVVNDSDIIDTQNEMEFNISHIIGKAKFALTEILGKYINYCTFYNEEIRSQLIYENDMEYALENNEFVVYIQPKYDIKNHVLTGGEALVRWNHHTKGFLPPDKFVPLFEKNGFIVDLDMYVFETVCKMQKKWLDMGLNPVRISVNQSRMHLFKRDYVENLKSIIDKYNVPPELIELEITETIAFESMDVISDVLNRLHNIGFKISMDDFGSGYSSLNMLKNLDVDVLKIDKGFFEETSNTKRGQDIIESIIDMASKLGIETVAEGVETVEQVELLQGNGCDVAQGYFYAMPMSIEDYENSELIEKRNKNNKSINS